MGGLSWVVTGFTQGLNVKKEEGKEEGNNQRRERRKSCSSNSSGVNQSDAEQYSCAHYTHNVHICTHKWNKNTHAALHQQLLDLNLTRWHIPGTADITNIFCFLIKINYWSAVMFLSQKHWRSLLEYELCAEWCTQCFVDASTNCLDILTCSPNLKMWQPMHFLLYGTLHSSV